MHILVSLPKKQEVAITTELMTTNCTQYKDAILVKKVDQLGSVELVFWRMLIQTIILVPIIIYRDVKKYPASSILGFIENNRPAGLKWMLLRGVCGTVTLCFIFASFDKLPVGDVISLTSSSIWTRDNHNSMC